MKYLKVLSSILLFIFLTLLTQIGGMVFLICFPVFRIVNKKWKHFLFRFLFTSIIFLISYLFITFFVIPFLAKPFGRVPLTLGNENLKPLNILTCVLNRNYVKPELKEVIEKTAKDMNRNFPGTTTLYLDANFPFINKFPLLPHLSHNDGQKADLAFYYLDAKTHTRTQTAPSFIGYGICEEPQPYEQNMAEICEKQGFWQYSMLKNSISQKSKSQFIFDEKRTRELLKLLAENQKISKIFIEPHLKFRLKLNRYPKIMFHGCHAVRHDDHIHIQL